jgi:seryl-tRNA synthetase
VYKLDERHGPELCLSGTAEMALAAMLTNTTIPRSDVPVRLAAVSRCYRAETSSIAEERGVYR